MHCEVYILKLCVLLGVQLRFVAYLQSMNGGFSCGVLQSAVRQALHIPFRETKRSVARIHLNQRQTLVPGILYCHTRNARLA
jgi:hypothetical protein